MTKRSLVMKKTPPEIISQITIKRQSGRLNVYIWWGLLRGFECEKENFIKEGEKELNNIINKYLDNNL